MPRMSEIVQSQAKLKESLDLSYYYQSTDTMTPGLDPDEWKYRRLGYSRQDVPALIHDRMLVVSLYLWQTNPIARRMVDLIVDFTVGDEVMIRAEDPAVQELLVSYWNDYRNHWDTRKNAFAQNLSIFGELVYFQRQTEGGIVRLVDLDPREIRTVVIDPNDPSWPTQLLLKRTALMGVTADDDPKLTINLVDQVDTPNFGRRLKGEAFWFRINRAGLALRGISDVFALADTLALYEQTLFEFGERIHHVNQWFWDVTLEGATQQMVDEFVKKTLASPPKPGAIRAHNERVRWEALGNKVGGADTSEAITALTSFVVTAMGIPPHWTGMQSSGRSAAAEAADPTFRHLVTRQQMIHQFLRDLMQYQIDTAIMQGKLDRGIDERFRLLFPKVGIRDFLRQGGAIMRLAQSIKDFVDTGLISDKDAKTAALTLLQQTGTLLSQDVDQVDDSPIVKKKADQAERVATEALKSGITPDLQAEAQSILKQIGRLEFNGG